MKNFLLTFLIFVSIELSAQITTIIEIGADILNSANSEKNKKMSGKFLNYDTIDNAVIIMSRCPMKRIASKAKNEIIETQNLLDKLNISIKNDSNIDFENVKEFILKIRIADTDWNNSYYYEEINKYQTIYYHRQDGKRKLLKAKEFRKKQIQDSVIEYNYTKRQLELKIELAQKDSVIEYNYTKKQLGLKIESAPKDSINSYNSIKLEKRRQADLAKIDSVNVVYYERYQAQARKSAAQKDSIEVHERTKNYYFACIDNLILYDKPNGSKRGKISLGSYVSIYNQPIKNGFIMIDVCGYEGYVLKKHLVKYINDLPNSADKQSLRENNYCGYESISVKQSHERSGTIISNTVRYQRGPRGGCYYINSSGRKEYVDRSLCN